jgi:hypothetical protein
LHERGRVFLPESGQQLVQRQDQVEVLGKRIGLIGQFESNARAAAKMISKEGQGETLIIVGARVKPAGL